MKKILFAICFALLMVGCSKNIEKDNIVEFQYGYGSFNQGYYNYEINKKDNKYIFTYKVSGHDANVKIKEIKKKDVAKLAKLIEDYEIDKWDGFEQTDDDVLDGYDFQLNVVYDSGETIKASGYMQKPENYDKGHNELIKLLESFTK